MSKHTPGPWQENPVHTEGSADSWAIVASEGGYAIADVWQNRQFAEAEANARLIAAAPELLEALKGLLPGDDGMVHDKHEKVRTARAAIAKATGEDR